MSADESTIRRARYSVTFDDLFHVPPGWLSWRCRLWRSCVDAGYEDGACKYDHNVDSWEQLAAETAEHLARWHPHVAALSAPVEAGAMTSPAVELGRRSIAQFKAEMAVEAGATEPAPTEAAIEAGARALFGLTRAAELSSNPDRFWARLCADGDRPYFQQAEAVLRAAALAGGPSQPTGGADVVGV